MPKSPEGKYKPTFEEQSKAEAMMTPEQHKSSKKREAVVKEDELMASVDMIIESDRRDHMWRYEKENEYNIRRTGQSLARLCDDKIRSGGEALSALIENEYIGSTSPGGNPRTLKDLIGNTLSFSHLVDPARVKDLKDICIFLKKSAETGQESGLTSILKEEAALQDRKKKLIDEIKEKTGNFNYSRGFRSRKT